MRKLKLPGRDVSRPRLDEQDVELIRKRGIDGMSEQARQIVEKKLRRLPENDGSQTPMGGNPVYKAMHACNVASRSQLSRSHGIPAEGKLSDSQVDAIVNLLTRWIAREFNFYQEEHRDRQQNLSEF